MRKAFSLIELLVAAAILSALAGVAMPVIGRFRQQIRVTECQFRLRTLANGLVAYASDAGGNLPPGPIEVQGLDRHWIDDPDRGSPLELFDAARIDRTDLNSLDGWYGQGLLWKSGYIDDGKAYFCPKVEKQAGWGYDQSWPKQMTGDRMPADGKTLIWSSYIYRGGLSSQAGTPDGSVSIYTHPSSLGIVADNPCFKSMYHRGGYNVAFLDASTGFLPFDQPVVDDSHAYRFWQAINAWK